LEDFELFNLKTDPYEQNNLVLEDKAKATALKMELDGLYNELITSENLVNQPRIVVGNQAENPIFLNRNDAGGERGIWDQEEIYGTWKVSIEEGHYNIRMKFVKPVKAGGRLYLEANTLVKQQANSQDNVDVLELKNVYLPQMDCDLLAHYAIEGKHIMPFWVEMDKVD
ncbi:MAG: arylsulfatase, partial [Allomuricauda sp.]